MMLHGPFMAYLGGMTAGIVVALMAGAGEPWTVAIGSSCGLAAFVFVASKVVR